MIQANPDLIPHRRAVKAVGLLSGGLDSTLAAKIIQDLGVEIHGLYFAMPWGCCDKVRAQGAAERLGIPLVVLQLDERYLEMVKNPQHGYGRALNPCVDCRIHMFSRAAEYMKSIGADFIFTGEVLGQRPMSQMRHSMRWIEDGTGLQGRLVRPLCAQVLEETIPEKEGLIDREKLLKITGRSRKEQIECAQNLGITEYPNPAGGCLLTDERFARRMKDVFQHGYRNFRETIALKWGRHFRIDEKFKIIVGRDQEENESLLRYAHPQDTILQLADHDGPLVLIKGENPSEELLGLAGGLCQRFSRYKDEPPLNMIYWLVANRNERENIVAKRVSEEEIEKLRI